MASEGYHEPIDALTDETRDMHRAITSQMEEPEAIDAYNHRVEPAKAPTSQRFSLATATRKKNMRRWYSSGYVARTQSLTRN